MDADAPTRTRGEIITFYSYKGGTGRTMALANVACLLAERVGTQPSVLVVDWDLEAPGLHRFLPPRLVSQNAAIDLGLDATPGLIDIFTTLSEKLPPDRPDSEEDADAAVRAAFSSIAFESFIADTAVPGVSILRAGRNDDGDYSKRVNTFDWEDLFHRAPTVYRAFAERLGEMFPYVLIDSRTGVTDISGICTSLLPEKLVVVFTPNRQSLTGVRELVERATSYRRSSDDLRPLLIYPLPSRIEASLQDLRTLWRLGSRDRNIIGYQPMFEELFVKNYGLRECDLSPYFEDVQIQQTPDYAYGEEIAVRGGRDRFSLANSYRVFVDRLVSGTPPWVVDEEPITQAVADGVSQSSPASEGADAPTAALLVAAASAPGTPPPPVSSRPPDTSPLPRTSPPPGTPPPPGTSPSPRTSPPPSPSPRPRSSPPPSPPPRPRSSPPPSPPPAPRSSLPPTARYELAGSSVFLSCAAEDRDRVRPIISALASQGFHVWDLKTIPAGAQFDRAVANALDDSDVVIVCWTKASIMSDSVLAEANEGLRRGILVPVLLDDVHPPLGFRGIQLADLRRDVDGGLRLLVDAVSRIAHGSPGTISTPAAPSRSAAPPVLATSERRARSLGPWIAVAAAVVVALFAASVLMTRRALQPGPPAATEPRSTIPVEPQPYPETTSTAPPGAPRTPPPTASVLVPAFKGEPTDSVRKAAGFLGLQIVFKDERGRESSSLEGVVVDQSPAANTTVPRGSSVQLRVATATAVVPTVVGMTLDQAVVALDKAGLLIATTGERPVPDVKPGTIVGQAPLAGSRAAVGSRVGVTIATPARRP